ncbi:MAG: dickkopf-related protein [Polyangiales bacterium]
MRKLVAFVPSLIIVLLVGCPSSSVAKKSPVTSKHSSVGGPDAGGGTGEGSANVATGGAAGSGGGARAAGGSGGATGGGAGAASATSDAGSSDAGSMPTSAAPTPLAKLPDALATAICDAMLGCVGMSALMQLTSGEDCVTRVAAQLRATEFAYMDQAIASGHVLYDSSPLPACMDGIRALGCDVLSHTFPAPCVQVLAGNVKQGDPCSVSSECEGNAFCAGSTACPSHCAALLGAGDACTGDNQCGDDLMCVAGQCVSPSLAGQACGGTSGKVCRLGFNCSGSTDTQVGSCADNASVQVGASGAACQPGGALCKEGLSCVYDGSSAFHCEPGVASGGACHLGLPKQCPQDEYCDATDVTTASTCKKLPGDGQACSPQKLCAGGSVCVADGSMAPVCRAIAPNGEPCSVDQACRSGSCMGAVCVPPPACM